MLPLTTTDHLITAFLLSVLVITLAVFAIEKWQEWRKGK